MAIRCDNCAHFRPKRRLEELFKLTTDRVSQAAEEIRKREEQWEEEESETLLNLLLSGEKTWPGRSPPRVLPYCGLEEQSRKFLVHESKDAGERCKDFAPSTAIPRELCSTCAHRRKPLGPEYDQQQKELIIEISLGIGGFRKVGDAWRTEKEQTWKETAKRLNDLSEKSDARKCTEMLLALGSSGEMPTRPEYYEFCGKFSSGSSYILCQVRNYHARCPGHSAHEDRVKPPPARRGTEGPSSPRRWRDGGVF
jgi:hypothetical protein